MGPTLHADARADVLSDTTIDLKSGDGAGAASAATRQTCAPGVREQHRLHRLHRLYRLPALKRT